MSDITELMRKRHSVRQYLEKSIPDEIRKKLNDYASELNKKGGLNIQIIYDEPNCFNTRMAHYGEFENCTNYIAMVGKKSSDLDERCGYHGELLVLKAQNNVSMYSTEVYFCKYGITNRIIYVKTNSYAADQQVVIHYNYLEGEAWKDSEAEYFTTLADGSKLWKASINSYNCEYAIKFTADGVSYWDNNNGQNYTNESLGTAPIAVNRSNIVYYNHIVTATLQNYAYEKNVTLRYTTDNWASHTDVPMSYYQTNANGTEDWNASIYYLPNDLSGFEYCVSYSVNGETYWANNFGENYDASYRIYP